MVLLAVCPFYIVPAKFCDMRFMNNRCFRDGCMHKSTKEKETVVRKAHVHLIDAFKGNHARDFNVLSCVKMVALQNIENGEELFENDRKGYTFF